QKGWTGALLTLTGKQQNASIVADLQDSDYEALDAPESKISMPLKQFRICRKRGSYSLDRTTSSVVETSAPLRSISDSTCSPTYQIHLSSRILFAKRHLWIGFNNVHDLDTWYPIVRGLVTKRVKLSSSNEIHEIGSIGSRLGSSHTSELDLLALALPSMHENDIYESTVQQENFSVLIVQTEKSREIGLNGRYTLRLTPTSFQLLDPISHAVRQIWPIRYVRKFGVHMKRFYLITGSGCDSGRGLFILYVPEANSLQHKLLNLTRQLSAQSTVTRRVTQPQIPTKYSSPQVNSLSEMIPTTDYWYQSEPIRKPTLFSPSTTVKAGSVTGTRMGSSSTLHVPASPNREQSVPLVYESDRLSQSSSRLSFEERVVEGRRYTNRSCQTLCTDERPVISPQPSTAKTSHSSGSNSPVYAAQKVVADTRVNVSEVENEADHGEANRQPVYANVEQLNEVSTRDDNKSGISPKSGRKPWEKGFTALHSAHLLEDQDSDSSEELEHRRWRITSVFEPIDEKDEHLLASSSGSFIGSDIPVPSSASAGNARKPETESILKEENNHQVSSSTPGDVPFDEAEFDSLEAAPKPALPVRNLGPRYFHQPVVTNFRKCVTRSATWDGWMVETEKRLAASSNHAATDASIQTDEGDDSPESGSDVVIVRTAL
ncbi:hypothetical protein FGIG_06477, partial [Fasciola gigantica]